MKLIRIVSENWTPMLDKPVGFYRGFHPGNFLYKWPVMCICINVPIGSMKLIRFYSKKDKRKRILNYKRSYQT